MLTPEEYYQLTRSVPTNIWTLDMAMSFATEYANFVHNKKVALKAEYTKNEIDFTYFIGVLNAGGMDALHKEIQRLKSLNSQPHQIIDSARLNQKQLRVFIYSKSMFDAIMRNLEITNDNVTMHNDYIFICINDTTGTTQVPYFEPNTNVLNLYFDDVDEDITKTYTDGTPPRTAKAFTYEQAVSILNFVKKHNTAKQCLVYCTAGVSRSGAVGKFINWYTQGDAELFAKDNPNISPSHHVYTMLQKAVLIQDYQIIETTINNK